MSLTFFTDEYFMSQALKEAQNAFEEGEIPVGAVIVCENKIIAKDHNRVERLQDATAHAEMLALTAAQNHLGSKYLDECVMYVTLEPCCMCAGGLFWTQMKRIVIGAADDLRGFTRFNTSMISPKTEIKEGVMASECEILVKDFFRKIRGN